MSKEKLSIYPLEAAHSIMILSMFTDMSMAMSVRNKLIDIVVTTVNMNRENKDPDKYLKELESDIYTPFTSIFTGIHKQFTELMEQNKVEKIPDILTKMKEFDKTKDDDILGTKLEMLKFLDVLLKELSECHEHVKYDKLPSVEDVFSNVYAGDLNE